MQPLSILVLLAAASSYPQMAPVDQYLIANPQDEIALARTAAPPSISKDSEVLVLGKHGYETAVKGKNGFVCFVERSWFGGIDDAEFWNPKIRAPNCFNPPAAHSVLPQYLQRTEWVLAGADRGEIAQKTKAAAASNHRYASPDAGSFSFMLSRLGRLTDDADGPWYPHVMFFVAPGKAAEWGAGLAASPILGSDNGALEPTSLFIPVPRWSDGSLAPVPPADHQHGQ